MEAPTLPTYLPCASFSSGCSRGISFYKTAEKASKENVSEFCEPC